MSLLELAAEFITVTCVGALSPGPLTLAVASRGAEEGWEAGAKAAVGHVAVELPLVILTGLGASALLADKRATTLLSLAGGAALLIFALLLLKSALNWAEGGRGIAVRVSSIALGAALSLLNPNFIAWWATAGLKVVVDVVSGGGLALLALLYPLHAGIDLWWLTLVAHASRKGVTLNEKVGPALTFIAALLMACYGVAFILGALQP